DVIAAYRDDQQAVHVAVAHGFGNGAFGAPVDDARFGGRIPIAAVDLDGDKVADFELCGAGATTIALSHPGTLDDVHVVDAGAKPRCDEAVIGDFNRDGRPDLATTSTDTSITLVLGGGGAITT